MGKEHDIIKKLEETVAACNRCGFCTSYCPTYNATGNEIHSPRGRNQMLRALIEGKVADPAEARESIDTCLLCGECTTVCFSEVPTAELMVQARHYLNAVQGAPKFLTFFLRKILFHPERLRWVLKMAFIGKNLGVAALLNKIGLLKWISPELSAAQELVEQMPFQFLLERTETKPFQTEVIRQKQRKQAAAQLKTSVATKSPTPIQSGSSKETAKVAFFPACGDQYIRPSIGLATVDLLKRLKVEFVIPESLCCGLPAASYGVMAEVNAFAQENIKSLEKGRYEAVVVDDSSCLSHLKDYPRYFSSNSLWLQRSSEMAQKVKDLSTFLLQRGLKEHLSRASWTGGPVAFHDPCKAQYGLKLTNPPRELLQAIPGLKLVEIADADQCCGGGGTYSFAKPELSRGVLSAKIKNIAESGCKVVVTSSASCLIQLAYGLRQKKLKIEALHLTEFLSGVLR
jgi:glycolate oxidase iron-sulfur subunit